MILLAKLNQHRRDFTGNYKCQFCGNMELHNGGYDDDNYHDNVIPRIVCSKCKKSTASENDTTAIRAQTKHPAWKDV